VSATLHLLLAVGFAPTTALLLWALPSDRHAELRRLLAIASAFVNLGLIATTLGSEVRIALPWFGTRFDLSLRAYHTACVFATAAAVFGALVTVFSTGHMKGHRNERHHYAFLLLTLGFVNGALLSNSLIALLFFWEGLLGCTYGLIVIGGAEAHRTATKAFVVSGIGDLCFMLGLALVWAQTKTLLLTDIHLVLEGQAAVAFVLLLIGALAKCGAVPFHSWIPDAALDAPAPFMALLPASIEKLLGVYFLSRLTLDLYSLTPESWGCTLIMSVGAVTLLLAVLMAIAQDDYRRLLAFSAISQVGLILLGIGSLTPIGLVGGLFHTFNHATYKCGMFLVAATVERRAHSTRLSELGGLYRRMPVTFSCFLLTAASGAGVPLFAGFFSKELIFDALLGHGVVFYLVAVFGSFFTTVAFLKMGHAIFFGKQPSPDAPGANESVEAPTVMLIPLAVTAAVAVLFGLANAIAVPRLILPMLQVTHLDQLRAASHHVTGWPSNSTLVVMTLVVSLGAVISHGIGAALNGGGSHATDHILTTPGFAFIYDRAERRGFDPYDLFMRVVMGFARLTYRVDRANDWVFVASAQSAGVLSRWLRALHRGNTSDYLLWSLVAATLALVYLGK
jgi:NADH-quinone oxidoreductase subunit L